jgi:DNA invertase Pin-like site-specific DNA recombinase
MAHLIGYARVSTDDQTMDLQLDALEQAGCARVFRETAHGATSERPQLKAALEQVLAGDTLVVWRLDRLGRSLPHLIEVVGQLRDRGVGLRSLTEGIDTNTATGELVFHIFASLAQFERRLIVERTHAGLAAARARGRVGGRPTKMTPAKLSAARALLAQNPRPTLDSVATAIGVGRTTLARHLAAADA